jgi:dTDP-4-dehydrorhamnose reductase
MAPAAKVLVLGATGRLGQALVRHCTERGIAITAWGRAQLDLADHARITPALRGHDFDTLINASGLTDVDYCETHHGEATGANAIAPGLLAQHCAERGARLVQVSTDYVFAGETPGARRESDPVAPVSVYGITKLAGEVAALQALPSALVTRVSWLFGREKTAFPDRIVRQAMERLDVSAVNDKWSSPTYAEDLCEWILALVNQPEAHGVFHLCNTGSCSWQEYAQETLSIAQDLGFPVNTTEVRGHTMQGFAPFLAKRPQHTALDTTRFTQVTGIVPRPWEQALAAYLGVLAAQR